MPLHRRAHRRAALLAASGAAVAALVAGCGSSSSGSAASTPSPAGSSTMSGSGAGSTQAAGTTELKTASSSLGTIVTDGNGFTLYRFDKDTTQPPTSNCNGNCATMWPPVVATGGTPQLKGIDAKLVSTVTRADGTKQVTLNGAPLYRYAPDAKPGDTGGQGFGGLWWVVGPDGARIMATASSPSGGSSGGGY